METVYLSRRNLVTLLNKLDRPESARALLKCDTKHPKYPCTSITLVAAVEDDEYYADRAPGPVLDAPDG